MDFLTEVKGQAIREPAAKIPFSELGQLGLGQMAIFCLFLIMLFLQQSKAFMPALSRRYFPYSFATWPPLPSMKYIPVITVER